MGTRRDGAPGIVICIPDSLMVGSRSEKRSGCLGAKNAHPHRKPETETETAPLLRRASVKRRYQT
jgi:hypothetical protein